MAWTLADARQFLQDYNYQDSSSRGTRIGNRIINDAAAAMYQAAEWDFTRRTDRMVLLAYKTAGTVSVAADGTAVTGVGTAFAAADVGSFIRFQGEDLAYEITAYTSATEITIENYRGASNLSAVAYELTNERVALPAGWRKFENPILSTLQGRLAPCAIDDLQLRRHAAPSVGEPTHYAVDFKVQSGHNPTAYLWVYPSPSEKRVIVATAFHWPNEATADADGFGFPADARSQAAACRVHREFILAFLLREQGKLAEYQTQLQYAEQVARTAAGSFRPVPDAQQVRMWSALNDGGQEPDDTAPLAPGEPAYEG